MVSAIRKRCLGGTNLTPSTPAVFFPWFSCVTRRTASRRAALDFISNFWSVWTACVLPRCSARKMRFCMRYTCCSSLRQGSLRQLSLSGSSTGFSLDAFVCAIRLAPLSSPFSRRRQHILWLSQRRWLDRAILPHGYAAWSPAHRIDRR